jgi:hypothetical protein
MVHYIPKPGARLSGWEYPEGDCYVSIALSGTMQINDVQTFPNAGLNRA